MSTIVRRPFVSAAGWLTAAFVTSSAGSLVLLAARSSVAGSPRYRFLVWNLFLAWLPLVFAWLLHRRLAMSAWLRPGNLTLTASWLAFLPNSFYIVSDVVHIRPTGEVSVFYDIAMVTSFAVNGVLLGIAALYLVHRNLVVRVGRPLSHVAASGVLGLCGFGVYLGRVMRANSWDLLLSPTGVLHDASLPLLYPRAHLNAYSTTAAFFVLLAGIYLVTWHALAAARAARPLD